MLSDSKAPDFNRATRLQGIELSTIVRLSEEAKRRKLQGKPVIALSTGEPDFETPAHIVEAAVVAARGGDTRYSPTAGTTTLREQIIASSGLQCSGYLALAANNVIVSTGAKQVLSNALLATINPFDEVIMPAPYWTSYSDMVALSGGIARPVICDQSSGFKLSPEQLEEAITPQTKWLMLNSPGNPSGAVYSRTEFDALAAVLRRYPHIWIMSDEIYQHLTYGEFNSFLMEAPDLADRTLLVNGVSKAYAMTGWRIGWGIGPIELIKAMIAVQGQTTSGACTISQAAALAALQGPQELLISQREIYQQRRDQVVEDLNDIALLTCPIPDGAFYVFPSCEATFGKKIPAGFTIESDMDFCSYLLESQDVVLVPGSTFGLAGHFRLSFAYSNDDLKEGCRRIKRACSALEQ